ncbi:MAG: permease prefix domain 1-containing protein [Olsenella sp.]|nr:permease prefix domain 1-containing protein [Olsenella sp.]
MMDDIRDYLESVFSKLPQTPEAHRAKDELGQMMEDKYAELLAQGMSEKDAAEATIAEFGNPDEVLESLGVKPQQGRKRHPGRVIAAVLGVIALCCVCWVVFWGRAEADPHAGSVDATIAEDFSSVDVHAACADVVLKSGDVTQVSYSGAANTSFEYEVQDGVLRVT